MKKLMMFLSLCGLLLCVSCRLDKGDGKIPCAWQIYNGTAQTLILKCPYSEWLPNVDLEYKELKLKPSATLEICKDRVTRDVDSSLDYYFEKSAEKFGEDVSWQILSEDGVVLKTWKYSDKDLPDQRFFEESEWDYYYNFEWLTSEMWSFIIQPEDIQPTE